jgi:hypothetical protein
VTSNCSTDVSSALRTWFKSLPAGQTVVVPSGACYLVNEGIRLHDPQRLTIYGGTFRTTSVSGTAHQKGDPVFTVVGGSGLTLEAMAISGPNRGGYHPTLAFAGGIELEGTADATIRAVTISKTFGDGITLAPLRAGADHNSGTILAPVSAATIENVTIDGVGRQGVTFASVAGATLSDIAIEHTGLDTFDFEADQWNEGATDVTIDGCTATGGALFLANGGNGGGGATHDITVEHCTMTEPEGGSAVLVQRKTGARGKKLRGPFTLLDDTLLCGASDYVACLQLTGGDVAVTDSTIQFPAGTVHEAVYHLGGGSQATFENDVVTGYGQAGHVSRRSTVHVTGGQWIPAGQRANNG